MTIMAAQAFWRASTYSGAGNWLDDSGNSHDATFNGATFKPYDGEKYLSLDANADNYASTPDANALDITADYDLRCKAAAVDWTPTATAGLIAKNAYTAQNSYRLLLRTAELRTVWWWDGANGAALNSTAAVPTADGTVKWVRVALDVDNGASDADAYFYISDNGSSWSDLGTNPVNYGSGTTSVYAGTSQLEVGRTATGASSWLAFNGDIYRAQVYDGIGGTLVLATVTINRAATGRPALIVDRDTMWAGADDYFEVADHANLDFSDTDDLTVAFYGRVYDATPAADMVLIGKKDDLTTAAGYCVYLDTTGVINGLIADGTNTTTVSSAAISAGYSFVVVLVRNTTAGNLQMYINGVASGGPQSDTTTATLANARPLRMGASSNATPANHLDGEIVGAAVFREALSAAAVWALNEEFRETGLPTLRKASYYHMQRNK
jgi:hypothetical protein